MGDPRESPLGLPDITEDKFDNIRCSKCLNYLNCAPIMMYPGRNNYAECGRCFDIKAAEKAGLKPFRNHSYEALISIVPFPCVYNTRGCTERRLWPENKSHEKVCLHRPYICPTQPLTSCNYEGNLNSLSEHFNKEHPKMALKDGVLIIDLHVNDERNYLIEDSSNIFVLQMKIDTTKNKIWFGVVPINMQDNINLVKFNIKFSSMSKRKCFTMEHVTWNDPVSLLNVEKALDIDIDGIRMLLQETDQIECKVVIKSAFGSLTITEEIECPVCREYMIGDIHICQNGHNVCTLCKEQVTCCPTCRVAMQDCRNRTLEKLISSMRIPCRYRNKGCMCLMSIHEIKYHENNCTLADNN